MGTYRLAGLPLHNRFAGEPSLYGYLEYLLPAGPDALRVIGWVTTPGTPLDQLDVYLDGEPVERHDTVDRPDVAAAYPWLPHAARSGFDFVLPLPPGPGRGTTRLDLIGLDAGRRCGRLSQLVRADIDGGQAPPDDLIFRVSHMRSAHSFKVSGLKSLGDILEPLARHTDISRVSRVLDWGCGCGRVAAFFLAAETCPDFAGCDIDPETVAWCNRNLAPGRFTAIGLQPPTPYPSESFDFIYSWSVLTHLTRDAQRAWLAEVRRLLAPGGIFIATTHGRLAYQIARGSLSASFGDDGIDDGTVDRALGSVAPESYYRSTYQSKEYTVRLFSDDFTVLEYVERGAMNFQDLVVARK